MNQYKQLKLSVEASQQALNKLHLAIIPKMMKEIASATNLELKVDLNKFQIGYQLADRLFVIVAEFSYNQIAERITSLTIAGWLKITVTEIINTVSGNEAFAEYQKRKSATNYRKALESIPETKRHALDNGEFSQ